MTDDADDRFRAEGSSLSLTDVAIVERWVRAQPAPCAGTGDMGLKTVERIHSLEKYPRVVLAIVRRREAGLAKYGTPLQMHNGRDSVADTAQEVLDGLQYLEQARCEHLLPDGDADRAQGLLLEVLEILARAR